ncbi:protein of unknown function [Acidithiobacillus ferrivorans]|uniref:Uncharacterized protein n=1 Tax=Acidithiobacillus ferrivorans TaxID=160808 RepID=A0A060UKM9_9PROT|nr:hypothetical protein AFERRI_240081 [Acidithiobacillus ferrivorans]SMH64919.1 protein of unknown function [Acidithiobacillus ferrivorans]
MARLGAAHSFTGVIASITAVVELHRLPADLTNAYFIFVKSGGHYGLLNVGSTIQSVAAADPE